jgi:interleukin-1 receptor-associated kinase 2
MGKAVVKEICQRHVEKRAGLLPEACEEAWATAVSVCLRRRNASVEEVSSLLPAALPRRPHVLGLQ